VTHQTPLVGVDNYSYHRFLGEVRPGERTFSGPGWTWLNTVDSAAQCGADVIALETCFIRNQDGLRYLADVAPLRFMFSWGHPYGLEYGTSAEAEADAIDWIRTSANLGCERMRIVIAHPALRDQYWQVDNRRAVIRALRRMADVAESLNVRLAIENHADLTAAELLDVLAEVDASNLEVCFDIANAVRVGDDPMHAATALAPHISTMHVKDADLQSPYGVTGPPSVPLGTGSLPIRQAIDVVLRANPDAWLLVELAHLQDAQLHEEVWIRKDIDWIRGVVKESYSPQVEDLRS
jgi:sugar phosphate isomerase/epimerase